MSQLQGLSVIAADAIASKIAKPRVYTNAKFVIMILLSFVSTISMFVTGLMAAYTAMVDAESMEKLHALLILSGASFTTALAGGLLASRIYKKEELTAFIQTKKTCEFAIEESLKLIDKDLSKPIQENPIISLAVACAAGSIIGKKL